MATDSRKEKEKDIVTTLLRTRRRNVNARPNVQHDVYLKRMDSLQRWQKHKISQKKNETDHQASTLISSE